MLTAEVLRTLLRYEPETGLFFRLCRHKKKDKSAPSGYVNNYGYVSISVLSKNYRAHRLAWLYVHGEWPDGDVDHINRDRTDNRIANLRKCARVENCRNKGIIRRNACGAKGVSWQRKDRKYHSRIMVGGKYLSLGLFDTVDEAAHAYNKGAIQYYGEFACLNPIGKDKE